MSEPTQVTIGDCMEVLPTLGPDSFDAVITDPPYNVGKDYGGHDDSRVDYQAWLREVLSECARVSRDAVVFFPGTVNVLHVNELLDGTSLRAHRMLGWHKREFAGDKWNGGPAMCWEPVVWASKAEKPAFNTIFGSLGRDFWVVNATHGDPFKGPPPLHPCPKPMAVMAWLVGLFVPEGGSVLDPFAGTGTTLKAARDSGRTATGIELNPDYAGLAEKRLAQRVLDFRAAAGES